MTDDCFGELVIETMAGRHIDAVKAVDELCYAAPWSKATWRREITEPSRCHLIARSGPTLIGHAGLLRVLDEAHITTVAVHPDRQGERIGTRLVLELLRSAVSSGSEAATLEVRSAARRTQKLYARFGFGPAGVRPRYYSDPVDDAVVMWLHNLQGSDVSGRLGSIEGELAHQGVVEGARS